jgi:hypothetical protein
MKKTKKKQRLPKGWTEEKIRKLAEHHDNMTEDEQVAEIENSLNDDNQTMMMVPTELVPAIVKLINKKRPAQDHVRFRPPTRRLRQSRQGAVPGRESPRLA